jgi:hypothetical protein
MTDTVISQNIDLSSWDILHSVDPFCEKFYLEKLEIMDSVKNNNHVNLLGFWQ